MGVLPKQWICLPELTENVRKRVTGAWHLTLSLWPSMYNVPCTQAQFKEMISLSVGFSAAEEH